MADSDTSLMLVLNKAARKLHRNGMDRDRVQQWLIELTGTYDTLQTDTPHCAILTRDYDAEEDATIVIAGIDANIIQVAAGRGESADVANFVASALSTDFTATVAAARAQLTMQERELNFDREALNGWSPEPSDRPIDEVASVSTFSQAAEAAPRTPSPRDQSLATLLGTAAADNQENRLDVAPIKDWLIDFVDEIAEENARFPDDADEMQWNMLVADHTGEEPAVFCLATVTPDAASLLLGTGEREAVRDFGENADDKDIIAAARKRFSTLDTTVDFNDRESFDAWLTNE